jgi:hypothetical protein
MNFLLKRNLALLTFSLVFFIEPSFSQKKKQLPRINALKQAELGRTLKEKTESERANALKQARIKGWDIDKRTKDGRLRRLVSVDSFGIPIYEESDDNAIAAATTRTNHLYSGGSLNLNLSGSTMPSGSLGLFETGTPLATHQELAGRIQLVSNGAPESHATHVAGTIMAAGINPAARGMAYQLPLLMAFNTSEVTMNTYSNQLLLSNHSYGTTGGWYKDDGKWIYYGTYNSTEDYKFGYYDSRAQRWDEICYNAPYYLPLKSAGNFRTRTGPAVGEEYWGPSSSGSYANLGPRPYGISSNNGFNTVTTYGNAKNILTVGAIHGLPYGAQKPSDIKVANFSSWGPTDDGRIKPDLVANGIDLLSSDVTSTTAYIKSSGTSMSTPNATGTLTLLQELFHQRYSAYMRSATLKGLVLATTTKAGNNAGPNYVYGWGLLNAERAATAILENGGKSVIDERILEMGKTEDLQVVASGNEPLVATICWTDPAAVALDESIALNNTTPRLVNDLDIRGNDGTNAHFPWILDPANPAKAATKGDNFRDNVEQVYIENPIAGKTYAFTIGHKNGLKNGDPQPYSIIITGAGGVNYCNTRNSQDSDLSISDFQLANINHSPNITTTYADFTDQLIEAKENQQYTLTLQTTAANSANAIAKIFIDWNNDGDFDDANELVSTSTPFMLNGNYSSNISVPNNLSVNTNSRLRVVLVQTEDDQQVQACGSYANGITYDYSIKFSKSAAQNAQQIIVDYGETKNITKGVAITSIAPTKGTNVSKPNQYGTLTNFVGSGTFGSMDSPFPWNANFANPLNLEFDDNSNLFITENSAPGKIRAMKAATKEVITICDTYPENHFTFAGINGLAIYGQRIYVVSEASNTIRYANIPSDIATPFVFNTITLPEAFSSVIPDLAVDSTSSAETPIFYLVDNRNSIKRVQLNLGSNTATLLSDLNIPNTSPTLNNVNQLKVMANRDIYVANRGRQVILKYSLNENNYTVTTLAGIATQVRTLTDNLTYNSPLLNNPLDLAVDKENNVYFTEYNGTRIRVYNPSSPDKVLTIIGQDTGAPSVDGTFGYNARGDGHFGMLIREGFIYFAQRLGRVISKVDISSGKFPYTISPALPTGLVFNNYTGEITGTPTVNLPLTNYTVNTYDNGGVIAGTATLSITVENTLPVKLVNFEVKKQTNGDAYITWTTSSESNNDKFIVLKSLDGVNFSTIGEKPTLGANGGNYIFIDHKVATGTNYYKLIQVDVDGTSEELGNKIISGGFTENLWTVYPNPSNGTQIKINWAGSQISRPLVSITNLTGTRLFKQQVDLQKETTLKLNNRLPSGMYIITIEGVGSKKLIVQ